MGSTNQENTKLSFEDGFHMSEKSKNRKIYSTGCMRLDELVGGFRSGELIELIGRTAVGKTQTCLTFAVSSIFQSGGGNVLFIDLAGSFEPARLAEILLLRNDHYTEPFFEAFMNRVIVTSVHSQPMLMEVLDMVEQNVDGIRDNLIAIIVDHINFVLNPKMRSDFCTGYNHMYSAGRRLKSMAVRYELPIVFVNYANEARTKSGKFKSADEEEDEEYRVALGQWWSTIANTRLLFTRTNDDDEKEVTVKLLKSQYNTIGTTALVYLLPEGVTSGAYGEADAMLQANFSKVIPAPPDEAFDRTLIFATPRTRERAKQERRERRVVPSVPEPSVPREDNDDDDEDAANRTLDFDSPPRRSSMPPPTHSTPGPSASSSFALSANNDKSSVRTLLFDTPLKALEFSAAGRATPLAPSPVPSIVVGNPMNTTPTPIMMRNNQDTPPTEKIVRRAPDANRTPLVPRIVEERGRTTPKIGQRIIDEAPSPVPSVVMETPATPSMVPETPRTPSPMEHVNSRSRDMFD